VLPALKERSKGLSHFNASTCKGNGFWRGQASHWSIGGNWVMGNGVIGLGGEGLS